MFRTLMNIDSNPVNISVLEELTRTIVDEFKFTEEKYPNILISLTESVSNAMIHGNNEDENKVVSIKVKELEKGILLRVSDQGDGFDFSDLPDPTLPENLELLGGRGIFLIKDLSDDFTYFDNGSTLEMLFLFEEDIIDAPIQFFSEDIDFSLESESQYIDWLLKLAQSHKATIDGLNYIFVDDEYLLNVNKEYLDHDYYTDIISFPMSKDPIAGDIFISITRVTENASELNIDFYSELQRVMAHGFLHFLGYDDHSQEDKIIMRKQEELAISLF